MIREWLGKKKCIRGRQLRVRHRNPIPVTVSVASHAIHTHTHTVMCVMHRKAAQGNGYADDEQKLKAINHFDLFCSFFRLKLILMPSVARQRGCPGAAQESVRKRER